MSTDLRTDTTTAAAAPPRPPGTTAGPPPQPVDGPGPTVAGHAEDLNRTDDGSAEIAVPAEAEALRRAIGPLAGGGDLSVTLTLVLDHRTERPRVLDAPVDAALAAELLAECVATARSAVAAELVPAVPGFTPGRAQWVFVEVDEQLAELDHAVRRPSHEQYDRSTDFGRRNLLVVRVKAADGTQIARLYQGFSPEKALGRRTGIVAFWGGERFEGLTEAPLVIDRAFRVLVTGGTALMPASSAYESLFGPPPGLREQAAQTFASTFGTLSITGAQELREACTTDPTMMRKMLSIERKLAEPAFRSALTMPNLLTFLGRNPKIAVKVDRTGPAPSLVFETDAQHRWALLKLLDDDFLHSELTSRTYEANSKSEL
ncbi:DUF4868 domain-containing protein [Nakamurella flavida]|uniref:DUF4868 domain-containing protein n=1 Tax=Nakamurella flavida TaxID=363630 RepID=A0A938YK52_9ACTN|nr:Kiwa anti-phage protein KwaB-like domain-containing protein [Nakamurella flavida]MBM9476649.1 DUF4868 domain-containing protein [Nakamurella flavida]MDP9778913.1 hypothetical protein [Nakamurella flavida]